MSTDIIVLENLRKEYYEVLAVRDVCLGIAEGEIFGLIGPNGAGKTTLLRMLATTLEPTFGRALIDGQDVWADPTGVRRRIGFMPDFFQMYNRLTVRENLAYFGIAHGLRGTDLVDRVTEVVHLIGLQEKVGSLARGLSRGMTQRLGLGRAILHHPKVLLLDEPASGLDPLARRDLFAVLHQIHEQGATILISSHILGELSELCTSIGIMHRGTFLGAGRQEEVLRKIMPKRRISLRLTRGAEAVSGLLAACAGVSDVVIRGAEVEFLFDGSDEGLADLNASLVRAGAGVALLAEARSSLHEAYFTITERSEDAPLA